MDDPETPSLVALVPPRVRAGLQLSRGGREGKAAEPEVVGGRAKRGVDSSAGVDADASTWSSLWAILGPSTSTSATTWASWWGRSCGGATACRKLRSRFQGLAGEGTIAGTRVLLLLPMTFMNLSGRAVG